jgi:signal transduction histidine kinase
MMQEGAARLADPEGMREALLLANEQVEGLISGLHGLITELRPVALDELGAEAAIEALVDRLNERHGLEVSVDIDLAGETSHDEARHTPDLEATIYRLVQEALTNVVKHSGADHARVAVEERGGAVTLTIEDDGRGLDPQSEAGGFGLVGMRERVALIGGRLWVGPGPGGGTRVSATLPATRRNGGSADV